MVWILVGGTRLFGSVDRGDTWVERALPAQLGPNITVAFTSDRDGWIATVGPPATQCQGQSVAISRTTDGAMTWQPLNVTGIGFTQCKEALVFSDAQRGYLSAWDPNGPPVIYRTSDGGATWAASRPLPDPPGFVTRGAGATLRARGIASFGATTLVNIYGFVDGNERDWVFRSSDGGATWGDARAAPRGVPVTVITPTRWIQLIGPDQSDETTDGGATWHALASDYSQAAPVAPQIAFGDAMTGYATVRGSLSRTVDGGLHWTAMRTPGTL